MVDAVLTASVLHSLSADNREVIVELSAQGGQGTRDRQFMRPAPAATLTSRSGGAMPTVCDWSDQ
jgi:hypothetical protein